MDRHAAISAALARPLLHTAHLCTFVLLLVTGLLLLLPTLRAALTGGYSQLIREAHRWGGVVFTVLPVALVLYFGGRTVFAAPTQRSWRTVWQGAHVGITLVTGVLFALTGFVIWWRRSLPIEIVDPSRTVHDGLTYFAAALLGAHLLEVAVAALVARVQASATAESRKSQSEGI